MAAFADTIAAVKLAEEPAPSRVNVTVRLRPASLQRIDQLARTAKVSRGEMIRALLAEAVERRPA